MNSHERRKVKRSKLAKQYKKRIAEINKMVNAKKAAQKDLDEYNGKTI